mmetsp:Transcript_39093/g.83187  ORF Transcript_39093/g.83187 Transcript_39093/m.83187 type:complete len:207 (-) Transcript_39093:712-1332(-)
MVEEEAHSLMLEGVGSQRVVVAFHHHELLRSAVDCQDLSGMFREDNSVVVSRADQDRHLAFVDVLNGFDFTDVCSSPLLGAATEHLESCLDHAGRRSDGGLGKQVHTDAFDASERAVQHHGAHERIVRGVQQCSGRTHGPTPEADTRDRAGVAKVLQDGPTVLLLEMTQGDVLALGYAASRKIKRHDRTAQREANLDHFKRLHAAT